MKYYRIFFTGYGGTLYDAGNNETIPYGINYISEDTAWNDLENWNEKGELRADLTYVVIPIFIPTK